MRTSFHLWSRARQALMIGKKTAFSPIRNVLILTFFSLRSLVDNLNFLKDEIYQLREQNRGLQGRLEEEVSARKRLESIMRCNLLANRQDIEWND